MNELASIANIPLVNILGIIVAWAIAERMGIPVTKFFGGLLNRNGKGEISYDWHEHNKAIQESLSAYRNMYAREAPGWAQELRTHFNDETSELLKDIRDKVGDVHDCLKKANFKLDEMQKYGIRELRK